MVHINEVVDDKINRRRQVIKSKPTWRQVIEAGVEYLERQQSEDVEEKHG